MWGAGFSSMPTLLHCGFLPVKLFSSSRLLALSALLVVVVLQVSPAKAQTLEDALVMAYQNNPTLLAARAELRSVDESIAQALSGWRPNVSASGALQYQRTETNAAPFDTTRPNNYSLNLTQPLYHGGQTIAQTSQADNLIAAQRASLVNTEQQILLYTVNAYMNVVLARSVLGLVVNNEQRLLRQLEATEDRFRVGEVTRTDVSQARARHAQSQAELVQADGDLISRAAEFERIVGIKPETLSRPGILMGLPASLEESMQIAAAENPAILQALAAELAAQDTVDFEIGDLLPEINLVASYSRNEDISTAITRQDDITVQAQVTIPLYQAGLESSQIREAQQTASQRRIQVDETRRSVDANTVSAWQDLATSLAEVMAFGEEVEANQIALEGTQREAQVGERTVLDILDAEQELFQSHISLAQAERDAVVASYTLQATLGRLTAEYLRLPVAVYDVEEHYEEARDSWWGYGGLMGD